MKNNPNSLGCCDKAKISKLNDSNHAICNAKKITDNQIYNCKYYRL